MPRRGVLEKVLSSAVLAVVFLNINAAGSLIEFVLQAGALGRRKLTIPAREPFLGTDPCLLGVQSHRFTARQFAAPDSLVDPSLFRTLPCVDGRLPFRGHARQWGYCSAQSNTSHNDR
jgi:hypothetical protein